MNDILPCSSMSNTGTTTGMKPSEAGDFGTEWIDRYQQDVVRDEVCGDDDDDDDDDDHGTTSNIFDIKWRKINAVLMVQKVWRGRTIRQSLKVRSARDEVFHRNNNNCKKDDGHGGSDSYISSNNNKSDMLVWWGWMVALAIAAELVVLPDLGGGEDSKGIPFLLFGRMDVNLNILNNMNINVDRELIFVNLVGSFLEGFLNRLSEKFKEIDRNNNKNNKTNNNADGVIIKRTDFSQSIATVAFVRASFLSVFTSFGNMVEHCGYIAADRGMLVSLFVVCGFHGFGMISF